MTRRKVYFWADAGSEIGYGHFVRSLALAQMLGTEFECRFYTRTPSDFQISQAAGVCPLVSLPADDSRFDMFLGELTGEEIVVLDNYFFSSDYQKKIKDKGCRLVCIDDIHDRHFFADAIINHCIRSCAGYDAEPYTRFYMGPRWALLREPFLAASRDDKARATEDTANTWVVTFGGSDPYDLTSKYVRLLKATFPEAKIKAIVGAGYKGAEALKDSGLAEVYQGVSAPEVACLLRSATRVLCSASSVCYEALACGCTVYAGYYVDNQSEFYCNLVSEELVAPLGNLLERTSLTVEDFNPKGGMSFDDVAERFRSVFRALSYDVVRYEDMDMEQSRKVWECRNSEAVRRWMTNPEPFSFEAHQNFVGGLKGNLSKIYFAFFDGDQFVGSYDFIGIEDGRSAEHGLYVNPAYQGKGIGLMMEWAMDGEIARRGVRILTAEVLLNNDASYRFHLRAGYSLVGEDDEYYTFERLI